MRGATLDAGALIALERGDRFATALLADAVARGRPLAVPTGVLAQVWREPRRQVRLGRFLAAEQVEVVPLDELSARMAGQLCGRAGTADVIDASVVLCARTRDHVVLTSDPHDIRRLDPRVRVHAVG